MRDLHKGIIALVGACTVWGLSPLYYKLLADVPPMVVICHRLLWSCVFFLPILMARGMMPKLWVCLTNRKTLIYVTVAALMISVNWTLFVYAVQIGLTLEASLGYYIFPLVAVIFGMIFFQERLTVVETLAVGLAAVAVVVLTAGLGVAPWIALSLAVTFGFYGVVKKKSDAPALVSVTAEVVVLAPFALVWLFGVAQFGWTGLTRTNAGIWGSTDLELILLALSGLLTGIPLVLLSFATQRMPLASIGLIQYTNPTLQFICAVLIFGEAFTIWHAIAFAMIWCALALYSGDALRRDRRARKSAARVSTSSMNVT